VAITASPRPNLLGQDLRRRIGQGQDQRLGRHFGHHTPRQHAAGRQSEEHIRGTDNLLQGPGRGGLGESSLFGVHELPPAFVHDTGEIGQPDVFAPQTQIEQQVHAGQRRGAGAAHHHLDGLDVLADDLQAVQTGRSHDDGCAVLVVMEHRDLHAPTQFALDDEAFRSFDVLEVDGAEGGLERGDQLDQLLRVRLRDFDVEHVDTGEFLEQDRLALHDRLGRQRPDGTEPQHRGPIGDDPDQVAARRESKHVERIFDDGLARGGNAGRIRERQIALVEQLFGRGYRDFSGGRKFVIIEGGLPAGLFQVVGLHRPASRCCSSV